MKKLLGTTAIIVMAVVAHAQLTIKGRVTNEQDKPLQGAIITLETAGKTVSAITDSAGLYEINKVTVLANTVITARFVGRQTARQHVSVNTGSLQLNFILHDAAYFLEPLEIKAVRASDKAPFTKTNLTAAEIQKNNFGQDLPFIITQTPSVVINSDAGNGVGYTGIRIRGTDATRINITLNGIPYNDAESGITYFVDLPDFASSVNSIQIQRGVGTSTNGAGAFGATINVSTNEFRDSAYAEVNNSYGSFNTWKNTIKSGSGLLNRHFTADVRLSRITSDGFIDRASSNLLSAYFSAAYINKQTSLRLNIFSGREKTYQAWNGVPQAKLFGSREDLQAFYKNNIGSYFFTPADSVNLFSSSNRKYNLYTYNNQTDNYQQDHYQLFFNQSFSNNLYFNIASFLTRGKGYYEEYKPGQNYADYGLNNYIVGADTVKATDLVRQRWLSNYFYGQTASLQYRKNGDDIALGGSWTKYDGKHYGNIVWANIGVPKEYQYYHMPASKIDINVYAKWLHSFQNRLNVFGDLQYRYVNYDLNGFENNPKLTISRQFNFINPKAGISYTHKQLNAYISYAIANKEPNRDDFEAGKLTQPAHETLHDFEAGVQHTDKLLTAGATFYYMLYKNQLVLTGQINDIGAYTRFNVPVSYRAGVELQAGIKPVDWLQLNAGATFSQNKIKSFTEFIDAYDADFNYVNQKEILHRNTDIAFSPNIIANGSVTVVPLKNFEVSFLSKYVNRQYLDNTEDKSKSLRPYFTEDAKLIYTIKKFVFKEWNISIQVNNMFNRQYEPNGYTFGYYYDSNLVTENYYFPMAGTNVLAAINIRL